MALLRPNPFLPAPLSGVRQIEVHNEKGRLRWETDVTARPTTVGSGSSDPRLEPSVPLLTEDSQIGANLRVCADEEDRADFDQRS